MLYEKNLIIDKSKIKQLSYGICIFYFECFVNKNGVHQVNKAKAKMINQCCFNKKVQ
jgi:hypothetical protein